MEENSQQVRLPLRVERMIENLCLQQCKPLPDTNARRILASIGEHNSIHMLKIISQSRMRCINAFINYLSKDYPPQPLSNIPTESQTTVFLSPPHHSDSSQSGTDDFIFHSPFPDHLLRSPSSNANMTHSAVTTGASSSSSVQRIGNRVATLSLASPSSSCGSSCSPTRKKLVFSPPTIKNRESTSMISEQWLILFKLEFRKMFLVLNYIGRKKVEDVVSIKDANKMLEMKDEPMTRFESHVWSRYGHLAGEESTDRRKHLNWECGKTHHYHCHVWRDGSFTFQGPYLKTTKTLLHRILGDENVLVVKFEEAKGVSTFRHGNRNALYHQIAKEGILVGPMRYRFFVFKDGERKGKKKSPIASDVKCYFIRMELIAPCDIEIPFNLLNKTMHEARCLFMHLHTTPSMAKYASRCSLTLTQTIKIEVNLDTVHIEIIEDIPCRNENGISVCNEDGDLLIHTDGTGFISEDLARKCPSALLSARYLKNKKSEMEDDSLEGELTGAYVREPPLLMQCRLFYNGLAVKGTLLVNRMLPRRTIQIRPSMIKVKADPTWKGVPSVISLEVVNISRKPGTSRLSKILIPLLNFGGVPDQFFLEKLAVALEDAQSLFFDERSAVRVSVNHGSIDDNFTTANMILSGVPLGEPCVQHRLYRLASLERNGLRQGKLPISESFFLMGTADPTGLLNSDEVCIILDNGQISGKVLVYRYPGLHFGDVHVLNAVYVKEIEDVVGNAKYGIFFSIKGKRSVASEIANGDFDGDMYWVSKNNQLLQYFKESTPWTHAPKYPRSCADSSPPKCPRKPCDYSLDELEHELFELSLNTKNQNISMGVAADSWQVCIDQFLTESDNNKKKHLKEMILELIDIYYDALDAPKTGEKVTVPDRLKAVRYPHYMDKDKKYVSCSVLGKICDAVDNFIVRGMSSYEIRNLTFFEHVPIPDATLKFWKENYDNYRQDMTKAMSSRNQSEMDEVICKYKQILYGCDDFKETLRNINDVHEDALALYHVCYDYAKSKGDLSKCNFVWKVAGHALCHFHAIKANEKCMLYCLPSVLGKIIN